MNHLSLRLRPRAAVCVLGAASAWLAHGAVAWAAPPDAAPAPAPSAAPSAEPSAPPSAPAPTAPPDAPTAPAPGASPGDAAAAPAGDAASASGAAESSSGSGLFESSQSDSSSGGGDASTSGFDLNGSVRADTFVGKLPDKGQAEIKAAYSELAFKLRVKKDKYGDAYAEPRFRYGLQGEQRGLKLDLREAYVNLNAGPFSLRAGQQIVVWGRADALNPTSNITPVDFRVRSPIEDDRRVGNVGARAFLDFSPIRLEGVWMPLYSPTQLPPLPLPDRVTLAQSSYPVLDKGLEAGRIHLELPAFELSVSYLYGYAPLPGLSLVDFQIGANAVANIQRTPYNHHVVGFDFATTLGDFLGLRGEAAFREPLHFRERIYAPNPDLQYVAGVDHTFGDVSVIAQYIGRYTFNWQRYPDPHQSPEALVSAPNRQSAQGQLESTLRSKNQILFSQLHRTQSLASLRLEWLALHQTLSLSALGMTNFSTKEWALFPKAAYSFTDNLTGTVGAEIYEGPHDTLFGIIDSELSAGYAELRMAF